MGKPQLVKAVALFYVLQHITSRVVWPSMGSEHYINPVVSFALALFNSGHRYLYSQRVHHNLTYDTPSCL